MFLGPCCMKPWMDRPFLANRLGREGSNQRRLVGCCWVGLIRKKKALRRSLFLFTKNMKVEKTLLFLGSFCGVQYFVFRIVNDIWLILFLIAGLFWMVDEPCPLWNECMEIRVGKKEVSILSLHS